MQPDPIYLNDALFLLDSANRLNWPDLTRTNFHKILYFCSVLSPLVEIHWNYDFMNAPYGPFNRQIHLAIDNLAMRGYANIQEIKVQKDSKLRVRYKISAVGLYEINRITRLRKEQERLGWIYTIIKLLDIYGQTVITKLAYKEPTFYIMRRHNKGGIINLDLGENQSIKLIEQLEHELQNSYAIQLDTLTSKLITYFSYLYANIGKER